MGGARTGQHARYFTCFHHVLQFCVTVLVQVFCLHMTYSQTCSVPIRDSLVCIKWKTL